MGYRTKRDLENIMSWRPYSRRRTKRTLALWATIILLLYIFYDYFGLPPSLVGRLPVGTSAATPSDGMVGGKNGKKGGMPLLSATDGKIELPWLYDTIVHISQYGRPNRDRHVLFVTSTMSSAATLAGIACEMAEQHRNIVHLLYVGRSDVSMDFLKHAQGIGPDGCQVVVHDGRPNFPTLSDESRISLSATAAVKYAVQYISPQAILVDKEKEEPWFGKTMKSVCGRMKMALVELPKGAASKIPWITRLDAGALRAWHKPKVDIVIQADGRSGPLMELLKSLRDADYFGLEPPRLRIELEPPLDRNVKKLIKELRWPGQEGPIVRHRMFPRPDERSRSLELLESFYPKNFDTAILILDPSVEVSKYYFHWLTWATLEYKHAGSKYFESAFISGIALAPPLEHLNGTGPFLPTESRNPFFYSAPSAHACLIFGDYWAEFHEYARRRLTIAERIKQSSTSSTSTPKSVDYKLPFTTSTTMPLWYSLFLELVTARSYITLYPRYDQTAEALAILHPDRKKKPKQAAPMQQLMSLVNTLVTSLPKGGLPTPEALDLLGYGAEKTTLTALSQVAVDYKAQIADCDHSGKAKKFNVNELFCVDDTVMISRGDTDEVFEYDNENNGAGDFKAPDTSKVDQKEVKVPATPGVGVGGQEEVLAQAQAPVRQEARTEEAAGPNLPEPIVG